MTLAAKSKPQSKMAKTVEEYRGRAERYEQHQSRSQRRREEKRNFS